MMAQRSEYGSITTVRKGVQRVRFWADMHDGRGYTRHSATVRGSKRDAREYLSRMHIDHGSDSQTMSVRGVYETWYLPDARERLAPRTLKNYVACWENQIAPEFGNMPISDVRPKQVQEWLLTMPVNTGKKAMKVLGPLFDIALKYEVIDHNVMKVGYRYPSPAKQQESGIYTLEECAEIAKKLEGSPLEAPFLLAAFGSCRPGEALAPTFGDVSLVEAANGTACAVVAIHRQVDEEGNIIEALKTSSSERFVVIPEPWSKRIRELACEGVYLTGGAAPISVTALRKQWKAASAELGFAYHTFKNLRPSWRTFMSVELGMEPETLERLMGHVGANVTERHYMRPKVQQTVNLVAAAFERYFDH